MDEVLSEQQAADIAAVCDEEQRTTGAVAGARVAICKACDRMTPEMMCLECGCSVPTKTWIRIATCPIGKW